MSASESRSATPASASGGDAASILARLDERSEVTLRILRSLELRVVSAGLPGSRSNSIGGAFDPFGPPGAMASTLSPEDFAAEEAHFRSQTDATEPEPEPQAAEVPAPASPAMAELDLTEVQKRHSDPNPPVTARTPSPQGGPREARDGAVGSGPGSPLSPSREEELLARVAAAESAADALTADKEALWDQLEAVEEQRRSADSDATRLRSRVDELLTALGQAEERFREMQAQAVSRHADDALDEAELGSRGALSRSPSMSLVDHNLGATPSEFNDTIRSAAGGSPAPSAVLNVGGGGATQGEQTKFGFKLRYPHLPRRGARRQGGGGLGGTGSPSSPHGAAAVRRAGTAGAARQRGLSNTSFPQSPLTSVPSSQARDDTAAHDTSLAV